MYDGLSILHQCSRGGAEGQTTHNQKIFFMQWARLHNYVILDWFEDAAITGTVAQLKRKGFSAMLQFLRHNPGIDACLTYEISRFGRSIRETVAAITEVEKYNHFIACSPTQEFLTTLEPLVREHLIHTLCFVAALERRQLIQRTRDGMTKAKLEGKIPGRPPKEIDPDEVMYHLTYGKTKAQIAKILGVSKGTLYKAFYDESLRDILRVTGLKCKYGHSIAGDHYNKKCDKCGCVRNKNGRAKMQAGE